MAKIDVSRFAGSMPWLKPIEKQRARTRVFKSGNSLAVRIPGGTLLAAGMEMDLVVEHGMFLGYEPVDQPKPKFNIAKVAGSATSLQPVTDRTFVERRSATDRADDDA